MATASRIIEVGAGAATTASTNIILLPVGSAGTALGVRRLIHPDSANFPAISYFSNPTRTTNIDNIVLPAPITNVQRTLSSSVVTRFEGLTEDVVITERWKGGRNEASMPTSFFRQLYEYLVNVPAFSASSQTYIVWEPADKTVAGLQYNIEMLSITVGGGSENNIVFDIADVRPRGGLAANDPLGNAGTIPNGMEDLTGAVTGLVDRTVIMRFRIVGVVA